MKSRTLFAAICAAIILVFAAPADAKRVRHIAPRHERLVKHETILDVIVHIPLNAFKKAAIKGRAHAKVRHKAH